MASLQEIKTRLSSVATTKKITKAMQLVATAKLRKAKSSLESIQDYYTSVYETFQRLLSEVDDFTKIYKVNESAPTLYIVLTSDLGLCGSYNTNVLKLLASEAKSTDKVMMVGTKGVSAYKAKGFKSYKDFAQAGDEPNYFIATEIGREALALFATGEISGIKLIHTEFINSVTFETVSTQILPAVKDNHGKDESKKVQAEHVNPEFEPDPETVIKNAMPLYVNAVIFGSMVESKVSEMSSRRTAMENATDNADDLIEKLDLEYNRVRQASITQEISEIVAGSEE